jgi:hypothetical protein
MKEKILDIPSLRIGSTQLKDLTLEAFGVPFPGL